MKLPSIQQAEQFLADGEASNPGPWAPHSRYTAEAYLSRRGMIECDRLVQLCDALCLPAGFCLMEKRPVDVAVRYGVHPHTVPT